MAQEQSVVGIDVSKLQLDWWSRGGGHGRVENTAKDCASLVREFSRRGFQIAVVEASGGYQRAVVSAVRKAGLTARVVNAKRVRRFAEAAGRRAKTDPVDAEMITWFGETFPEDGVYTPDPDREALAMLVAERQDFVAAAVQFANRAEHPGSALGARARKATLASFKKTIARFDAAIAAKIAQTPHLADLAKLLSSVPGLGKQTVAALIAWLPELGRAETRQLAALVGVAPYPDDSGKRSGDRHIAGGRSDLRGILYMATLGAATQHNPVLKAFYDRLRDKGKEAKVALIACMRKLLGILNAMVARNETWKVPASETTGA